MRVLAAIICLAVSSNAFAWWNEEWSQRKEIGVNTTVSGANTQFSVNEVPVLVRLHSGNFPQFLSVRDGGADFRFVGADDLAPLKYHVERFDPISELAYVWVKMPVVNAQTDTGKLYLYFGNQAAPKAEDAGATFDVNTVAAYHFDEASGLPADSTAYASPVASGELIANPASLIAGGMSLTGTAPMVLSDVPQLAVSPETGWTFETWIRVGELSPEPAFLLDRLGEGGRLSVELQDSAVVARFNDAEVRSFTPIAAATWHHVAIVVGPEGLQLYLDGAQVGGAPLEAPPAIAGETFIGGPATGEGETGGLLVADLDELRISNVARSPDWLKLSADLQGSNNDRVLVYGLDEGSGASGKTTGHFTIILQNVFGKSEALVEQLVILLCAVMMAIAIAIMYLKAVQLGRARKATKNFLGAFAHLGQSGEDDLTSLYKANKEISDSPLWRIYRIGIEEIEKRTSPAVGAQSAGLDDKSMTVVRAAIDAGMVREGQRLNDKLVLLTIAISGGPFIGLFGTVVGVMVTFAAIAATGDVNIATIAPGMAAALLATVAGLGVAIPSLFGYNYLGSQAKELQADMQVFADELEARFTERFGA